MGNTGKRRVPKATAPEQTDPVLSPERKRELTIETMASWALEGMEPDRQTVEDINAYLRGEVTMDEYLRKLKGGDPAEADGGNLVAPRRSGWTLNNPISAHFTPCGIKNVPPMGDLSSTAPWQDNFHHGQAVAARP
jgi:hypothetical protein